MSKIQQQANRHNESMRMVKHVYTYPYKSFLKQSEGNLLINGGLKEKRRECLLQSVTAQREQTDECVVIFSEDRALQQGLISLAEGGALGRLYVCSEEYPIYDFFRGMSDNYIGEYFNRIALERGAHDTSELNSYTDAFLSILSSQTDISLTSVRRFARNDDRSIAAFSQDPADADNIVASTRGGVSFRSLVNNTCKAFSSVTAPDCESRFSLSNLISEDCTVLINLPADNPEFFSVYFAMELKSLMNRKFTCVFDDSVILNNSAMGTVVEMMKQRADITVVISHENIVSVSDTEDITKNFNRNLILLNGNTPYVDLQRLLSGFGKYTHMQPMANKSTPPRLFFSVLQSKGEAMVPFERDRVILQEEYGNEALLKGGSSSEIVIAKRLTA